MLANGLLDIQAIDDAAQLQCSFVAGPRSILRQSTNSGAGLIQTPVSAPQHAR